VAIIEERRSGGRKLSKNKKERRPMGDRISEMVDIVCGKSDPGARRSSDFRGKCETRRSSMKKCSGTIHVAGSHQKEIV